MKKRLGLVAAVVLSLAVLGACGSNTNKQADMQVQTQAISTEQTAETDSEVPAETTAASGAVLTTEQNAVQNNGKTQGTNGSKAIISEDDAKAIVLEHAGLTGKEVSFVKVKTDYENGRTEYELEFYYENTEYDYELDAASGEILSFDNEIEYDKSGNTPSGNVIGEEKAKEIALERAGLSADEVKGLYAEYDVDDGIAEYEVQFYVGWTEYDVTINAETGEIIGYEEDRD